MEEEVGCLQRMCPSPQGSQMMQEAVTHLGNHHSLSASPESSNPQRSVEAVWGSLLSSCFEDRKIILQ